MKHPRRFALLLACSMSGPGCITERTTRPPVIVDPDSAPQSPAPTNQVVTPAPNARSTSTAARVALRPIGLVPYDGLVLPLISPDGRWLATQVGEAPTWDQLLGRHPALPIATRIEVYALAGDVPVKQPLPDTIADRAMLGPMADAEGFLIRRDDAAYILRYSAWSAAPAASAPSFPEWFERELAASDLASYQARTGASAATIGILAFSSARGRMMIVTDSPQTAVMLAPGSIAGCWVQGPAGEPTGVLITSTDGLALQRLTRDATNWRAEAPTRLLRDPWVPRAATDPRQPFILIGPGPRNRPDMLQITAMSLVE